LGRMSTPRKSHRWLEATHIGDYDARGRGQLMSMIGLK
jgi:hypothetical protein